jgi:hypothetical protein
MDKLPFDHTTYHHQAGIDHNKQQQRTVGTMHAQQRNFAIKNER